MRPPAVTLDYARPRTPYRAPPTKAQRVITFLWNRVTPSLLVMALLATLLVVISIHLALASLAAAAGRVAYRLSKWLRYRWQARKWSRREAQGACPFCGYDMRGTPQVCPECGQEWPENYRLRLHRQMWPGEAAIPAVRLPAP